MSIPPYSTCKIAPNLWKECTFNIKINRCIPIAVLPFSLERAEPSPLDNYLAPYLRAHATSCRMVCHRIWVAPYEWCHTHILFFCSVAMSGSSSEVWAPAVLVAPYWAAIVVTLFLLEMLTPQCPWSKRQFPRKQVLLYSFLISSSLILVLWCHFPAIWLVEESTGLPPSGDFFHFPCSLVQKGQSCSRLQRGRTFILAQFWVKCIRLARLVSSGESTRCILIICRLVVCLLKITDAGDLLV